MELLIRPSLDPPRRARTTKKSFLAFSRKRSSSAWRCPAEVTSKGSILGDHPGRSRRVDFLDFGRCQNSFTNPYSKWSFRGRLGPRQARDRFGPFSGWPNRSAQEVPKRSETESSTKTRDDGAHSRDDDGPRSRDDDGARSGNDDGARSRDDDGAHPGDGDGAHSRDDHGAHSRDDAGARSSDDDGAHSRDDDAARSRDDDITNETTPTTQSTRRSAWTTQVQITHCSRSRSENGKNVAVAEKIKGVQRSN